MHAQLWFSVDSSQKSFCTAYLNTDLIELEHVKTFCTCISYDNYFLRVVPFYLGNIHGVALGML